MFAAVDRYCDGCRFPASWHAFWTMHPKLVVVPKACWLKTTPPGLLHIRYHPLAVPKLHYTSVSRLPTFTDFPFLPQLPYLCQTPCSRTFPVAVPRQLYDHCAMHARWRNELYTATGSQVRWQPSTSTPAQHATLNAHQMLGGAARAI